MVNAFLIIIAVVMAFLVLGLVFYMMVIYSSEEDKNQAWLPKIVVLIGLSMACFNVLLLPYDVANRQHTGEFNNIGGGINTTFMWQLIMYSIAALTFFIVPFAMFYYEAFDPDSPHNVFNQMRAATCYSVITLAVFVILLVVLWITVGIAKIPYHQYANNITSMPSYAPDEDLNYSSQSTDEILDVHCSLFVYMVALISALGWILFFVFGGVGMASLPLDLIFDFRDRPRPISAGEYAQIKEGIGKEAQSLQPKGKELEEKSKGGNNSRAHRKRVQAFKQQVQQLEEKFDKLEICYKEQGGKILTAWLGLFAGVVASFVSMCWVIHIIIYNIAKVNPFLNTMFINMDHAFSLLGTLAYGLFAFYLLICVTKGCAKVGFNLLLFTVHPLKINGTLMNSFLFNTMLILIASVSVVNFCSISFREYASNTAADALFSTYVKNLAGLNYITLYLQYPMVAISTLSFFWLVLCPRRCTKTEEDD